MAASLFHIYAGPGSPYSHKMRALLRYRRIPHTWQVPQGGFAGGGSLGADQGDTPLTRAGKRVVPVIEYPDGEFKADSTPIIFDLEQRFSERSVIPPNPGIAFLAHLIEDMADEYMLIPMFYFRWTDDADWCARRQMIGWGGALDDETLARLAANFAQRQRDQLGVRAQMPRETMLESYIKILDAIEAQLKRSFFLFGSRPSLAEFGLYGQLSQYVIDPVVSGVMKQRAVRTFEWEHFLEDMSGIEGDWWAPAACLTSELAGLLASMAPYYFLMMKNLQNNEGMDDLEGSVNGAKYRVKCYLVLKQALAGLNEVDKELIRPILAESGCWEYLQFEAGEAEKVVPITPA